MSCTDTSPPSFVGHWRDWHRGHGCEQDDGCPRSDAAKTEVAQMAANKDSGFLTDAELGHLRASTTGGDELRVRALDELRARRQAASEDSARLDWLEGDLIRTPQRAHARLVDVIARLQRDPVTARETIDWLRHLNAASSHCARGSTPDAEWSCSCGTAFADYDQLREHVRRAIRCPRCGEIAAKKLRPGRHAQWDCGHWIPVNGDLVTLLDDVELDDPVDLRAKLTRAKEERDDLRMIFNEIAAMLGADSRGRHRCDMHLVIAAIKHAFGLAAITVVEDATEVQLTLTDGGVRRVLMVGETPSTTPGGSDRLAFVKHRLAQMAAHPRMWAARREAFFAQVINLVESISATWRAAHFVESVFSDANGFRDEDLTDDWARGVIARVQANYRLKESDP